MIDAYIILLKGVLSMMSGFGKDGLEQATELFQRSRTTAEEMK